MYKFHLWLHHFVTRCILQVKGPNYLAYRGKTVKKLAMAMSRYTSNKLRSEKA